MRLPDVLGAWRYGGRSEAPREVEMRRERGLNAQSPLQPAEAAESRSAEAAADRRAAAEKKYAELVAAMGGDRQKVRLLSRAELKKALRDLDGPLSMSGPSTDAAAAAEAPAVSKEEACTVM